jgi:hypothetical protein
VVRGIPLAWSCLRQICRGRQGCGWVIDKQSEFEYSVTLGLALSARLLTFVVLQVRH